MTEVYLLGLVRDSLTRKEKTSRTSIAAAWREKGQLARQVKALRTVNLELEERISRQEDSITSLYAQIQVLQSLNLEKALSTILDMVRRFVGASRCSIWMHHPADKRLELVARLGWDDDGPQSLPDEDTIEGWVVRNNMMFSVKMLLENEAMAKLDAGRNIMTLPISAGRRTWGILNVEEMPFEKYTPYAERLLLLIIALASPAVERAVEYRSLVSQEETNPVTGLPSFTQFSTVLQSELDKGENGTLAVVVFELLNFPALVAEHEKEHALRLLADMATSFQGLAGPMARFFHYKADGQLVLLAPNLDGDGASLLALTVLGKVNSEEWRVHDTRAFLELILGFAVSTGTGGSAEELLESAENLLTMQKA